MYALNLPVKKRMPRGIWGADSLGSGGRYKEPTLETCFVFYGKDVSEKRFREIMKGL